MCVRERERERAELKEAVDGFVGRQLGCVNIHRKDIRRNNHMSLRTCNKTFTTKGTLTLHKRTHTGVKPNVCEMASVGATICPYGKPTVGSYRLFTYGSLTRCLDTGVPRS